MEFYSGFITEVKTSGVRETGTVTERDATETETEMGTERATERDVTETGTEMGTERDVIATPRQSTRDVVEKGT